MSRDRRNGLPSQVRDFRAQADWWHAVAVEWQAKGVECSGPAKLAALWMQAEMLDGIRHWLEALAESR